MMVNQAIRTPFGINVFGSTLIRTAPDIASLDFAVSHLAKHPKEAFAQTRILAQQVRTYLAQTHVPDVNASHISLSEKRKYISGEDRFEGYIAKVAFNVLLRDLDQVEEILSGIVDAGVNEINSVTFQTSRLKEVRKEARQKAVIAAREKAEIYCETANVTLSQVLHIEDVNPDSLRGYEGHVMSELDPDDGGPLQAIDPGSIVVRAAVMVAFEITSITP